LKRTYLILALASACLVPGTALADTFSLTGSVQQFTAPTAGEYDIVAYGASGGNSVGYAGGLGAEIGGDFSLMAGEILDIYVGGAGQNKAIGSGGGGGGTFVVVDSTNAPLAIAGGGGGADGFNMSSGGPGSDHER
jgi:Glycine rich protein